MHLSVSNISKQYSSVLAVDKLSFAVQSGEIFAILGPNGAGKSSTIRMLIGLTHAESGDIRFTATGGGTYSELSSEAFGYLPEERGLFQENKLIDTLVYMGRLKGMSKQMALTSAEEWLERFDLIDRKHDALKTLSKGNQQKVQLVSAIIHSPDIVFLDEPFSGLDPVNQEKVIEFLVALKAKGTTIVLSAHQMSLVEKLADRFLLMNKGKAALYGDIASIREQSQLGANLQLSFEEPVELEAFRKLAHVLAVGCVGENGVDDANTNSAQSREIHLQLSPKANIPELLQGVLAQYKLASLQSEQATLHDIYLNAVKENNANTAQVQTQGEGQ